MRKRKSLPKWLKEKVFELKGSLCWCCDVNLLDLQQRDRTVDHIKLHTRGGRDTFENLRPACRRCNITRHAMEDDELKEYIKNIGNKDFMRERKKEREQYYIALRKERSDAVKRGWITRRFNQTKDENTKGK